MPGMPLSPELCGRIASLAQPRQADLLALCLTCKAFQREAEIKLYETLMFSEPQKAHLACKTVIQQKRLGLLVRNFLFNYETRRPLPLGQPFWMAIKGALNCMHNLEYLLLYDATHANTWIFDPSQIKFQLHEAKLQFAWDERFIEFLESQRELLSLQTFDSQNDMDRLELHSGSLPKLLNFDGTIMVSMQMLSCPLTHLQIIISGEALPHLPRLLPRISHVHKTLRGLSLLELTEEVAMEVMDIISSVCPTLRYIGLIPLPPTRRHKIYRSLLHMHDLRTIELEITRWNPQPHITTQRALAAEIKLYCPTIRCVIFWIQNTRFRWTFHHDWRSQIDVHLYPSIDPTWCSV